MSDIIRKCSYCQKVYFVIEGEACPFCGKRDTDFFDKFKDIFGDDNPFNNIGVT